MATSAASDNESLLRDMVSRLCALAAQAQPALAPALASIAEAARNNRGGEALESAFAKLGAAGKATVPQRDTVLRDNTDGRLIDDIGARLDHLQSHLQQQDSAGDARQRKLMEQLAALSQQVAQLSTETVNLRSRLDLSTEEALRDPLTGAFNRLAYDRRAALEVARCQSDGGALSMIICDIDHFKRINDQFGHAAGDKVLKEVVRLLLQQLRSSDFVGRYGGEEFVVLLSGAGEKAAIQIADKLRRSIKTAPFRSRGQRVPVTISCGVGSFTADDTLERVFERTDAALNEAKLQGRDRCVFAAPKAA